MRRLKWVLSQIPFATAILVLVLFASAQNSAPVRPGSINRVEGAASIGNKPLSANSPGVVLDRNQTLHTGSGKAELLLSQGVRLKVDHDSSLRMISPDLTNTKVDLESGRAIVEATGLRKRNNIHVDEDGTDAEIAKNGVYEFDADHGQIRVFKGKLDIYANDQTISLGRDHQITLNNLSPKGRLETRQFNPRNFEDAFYRSSY